MISVAPGIHIPDHEIEFRPIRAQGPGGQNVNKVSSALHLRFDIRASSLPAELKQRLLASRDRRITADGILVIKAQSHRSQEKNRRDALERLTTLIAEAMAVRKARRPTRPSRGARQRRMEGKARRGRVKALRSRPEGGDS